MTAAAGQLRGVDGVEAPVGGEHQDLRRGLGEEGAVERIVGLERQAGQIGDLAAQRADPALLRHHDRDRLALDQRLLDRRLVVRRRLGKAGAALAERRLRPEFLAHLADLAGDGLPLLLFGAQQASIDFFSARSFLSSSRISISSSLRKLRSRMLRMASACTSGELERLHQHRLRLVLGADDLDDLVEVEIGDQIAAEHFEPVLDLASR